MRILHVVECDATGVLALLRTYCRHQLATGHEVHVLAPHGSVPDVRSHVWHIDRRRPGSLARAARDLGHVLRDTRPDVVHLHSSFAGLVGRAVLPARQRGPGVVYQPHSWAFAAVRDGWPSKTVEYAERMLSTRTDHVVCNCEDELEDGRRHGVPTSGSAIGLPVDLGSFRPAGAASRDHLRAALLRAPHLALCVGRIAHQKGQDRLVRAWRERRPVGTELVLAGPGDVRQLRDLAGPEWGRSIRWVGDQADVRPWLQAADVLVVPSRYEGQSVAVSEALACGLPVVACDVNGAREAVLAGPLPPAGQVVGVDDMRGLIRESAARVWDQDVRAAEAGAARLRALAQNEPDAVMARLERAYQQAIAHRLGDRVGAPGTLPLDPARARRPVG